MSTHELTRINLDNEMDLILAHKRSMKLAEIGGLSLSAQTTFATAVSEVARVSIDSKKSSHLTLNINLQKRDNYIVAALKLEHLNDQPLNGLENAKKLVAKYNVSVSDNQTIIELFYFITPSFRIDAGKIDEWRSLFRNEPPISPYEELKRKNDQLQLLSEKIQKSEAQYESLANTLPLFIFSMNTAGDLLYANKWLTSYTGETRENIDTWKWKNVVHPDDYLNFSVILKKDVTQGASTVTIQARLKNKEENDYFWHQVAISPLRDSNGDVLYWTGYIADVHAQKIYEDTLRDNAELKEAKKMLQLSQTDLENNISDLNRSNHELQQFAFIASHDLQEPIRKILFYSDYLKRNYQDAIDDRGAKFLNSIYTSSVRMRTLIQDILVFSQVERNPVEFTEVDLQSLIEEVKLDFEIVIYEKKATLLTGDLPIIYGNPGMIKQLFENLVSNSLKYAKSDRSPVIEISVDKIDADWLITFRDNGIGFDEKYLPKLFTLFQRLHNKQVYEGNGIGLAICKKIVDIHRGTISAAAIEDQGAIFYVKLPAAAAN